MDTDITSAEQWQNFQTAIDEELDKSNIQQQIEDILQSTLLLPHNSTTTQLSINKIWSQLESTIITTAFKHLATKKRSPNYSPKKEKPFSIEHQTYRSLSKVQKKLQQILCPPFSYTLLEDTLQEITDHNEKFSDWLINPPNKETFKIDDSDLESLLEQIVLLKKTTRYIESRRIKEQIIKTINNHCGLLKTNQKRMITSILNRSLPKIILNHIHITNSNNQDYIETNL